MAGLQGLWKEELEEEFSKEYYRKLFLFVKDEYENGQVFPPKEDVLNAYNATPLEKVKVVLIGQDPYHDVGQAHGLCFSVKKGVKIPPSLVNIYKELNSDLGCDIPDHGCLQTWANQGVFLLNNVLTVRAHQPNSHKNHGWEQFTDATISVLNKQDRPIVFVLWGRDAEKKCEKLDNPKHLVLRTPHPSPFSAHKGFFGSKPFSKINRFLVENGLDPIDWNIT